MKLAKFFFYFLFTLFLVLNSRGVFAHIVVGGKMYYEFIEVDANNQELIYDVYLNFNVVCNLFDADQFSITVYDKFGQLVFDQFPLIKLVNKEKIKHTEHPCAQVDTSFCVERQLYKTTISLPRSNYSYVVAFQNCCRTSSLFRDQIEVLKNLSPELPNGISLFTEITPIAQEMQNSSAIFINTEPNIICLNENVEIDLSAQDKDNDSLIYELVAPNNTTLELYQAFPFKPPPYPKMKYNDGYSEIMPFGQNSILNFNLEEGILSVLPSEAGHYAIGVKVTEYKDGLEVGNVYNDIRIYVDSCISNILASIDTSSDQDQNVLTYCDTQEINILNFSTKRDLIDSINWTIIVGDSLISIDDWDANFHLDTAGIFDGSIFVSSENGCSDSLLFTLNVNDRIEPDFDFDYDTCVAGPVSFFDESISNINLIEHNWKISDVEIKNEPNPIFRFDNPDEYNVKLFIKDEYGCTDSISKDIIWLPAPETPIVEPDFRIGCSPLFVFFNNLSSPINEDYLVSWEFGNDIFSTEIAPSIEFINPGVYDVNLSITSPIGCTIDTTFANYIIVEPAVESDFFIDFTEESFDRLNNFASEVVFEDNSNMAVLWEWYVNGDLESTNIDFVRIFRDTGNNNVTLIVEDVYGCRDSLAKNIVIEPISTFQLPTAFTPNSDGLNDHFVGVGITDFFIDYEMLIFNRWGELIFKSNDPDKGWDGKGKSGRLLPQGAYSCIVNYENSNRETFSLKASFLLIR